MNKCEWEIRESNFGKGVFATKPIREWSKLVCLQSNINVLEDFALKNYCSNCLKHFSTDEIKCTIKCSKCSIMTYCSDKSCLENDQEYHKYECSWLQSVLTPESLAKSEIINLPSRSQRFLMRYLSHLELNCESKPNSDLIDNCENIDQDLLKKWKLEAEEIVSMVPNFAKRNTIHDLIRFFGILKSNSYMMRQKDSGTIYGGQLIEIHSRINHSCEPNCVASQDGVNVFLISIRDINVNEQITVSYTDTTNTRTVRQAYLKQNLFFDCNCSLCLQLEDNTTDILRHGKICKKCGKFVDGDDTECNFCLNELPTLGDLDLEKILNDFSGLSSIEKFKTFQNHMKIFDANHWFNNKLADMMTQEFCLDEEFIDYMPGLLVDLNDGRLRAHNTLTNPFKAMNRYEYALILINLCKNKKNFDGGIKAAKIYLKMAALIKGFDDELVKKITMLCEKWEKQKEE